MYVDRESFNRRAVKPMVCLREAWQVVKGEYWLLFGITIVGVLLGSMAALFLAGPLCGITYCFLRRERGQRVTFGMLFRGFDYFIPALIATLIVMAPIIVLLMGAYLLYVGGVISIFMAMPRPAPGQPLDPELIWLFIGMTAWYFLAVMMISTLQELFLFFTYALIVDRRLSGGQAVKVSIQAVFGNLWGVIGVIILSQMLLIMGMMLCYVGFIFVLPITMAMKTIAYQQVFEMELERIEEKFESPALPGPVETGIQESPSTGVSPREPGA